jgi:8-oxo-dGTP diphosphatase
MSDPEPEFGVRQPDIVYLERPGAYAVIRGADDRLAFVSGKGSRLFLPGGGLQPGEPPEDALRREIIEETGWRSHILNRIGRVTQFLAVEGEGFFAIRAIYFRARLTERVTAGCKHEIVWFPAATATVLLARESDAWAISRACDRDAILR